jgi:hypothetical protein
MKNFSREVFNDDWVLMKERVQVQFLPLRSFVDIQITNHQNVDIQIIVTKM